MRWGIPSISCSDPFRAISRISSSLYSPASSQAALKIGFTSTSSVPSMTYLIYEMANKGSMPEEVPAIRLSVPVGAIVVVVAFLTLIPASL